MKNVIVLRIRHAITATVAAIVRMAARRDKRWTATALRIPSVSLASNDRVHPRRLTAPAVACNAWLAGRRVALLPQGHYPLGQEPNQHTYDDHSTPV